MIRRIRGTAIDIHPTHVVVDVNGVGYLVYTTAKTHVEPNAEVCFFTHLAVRENALDLYGFHSQEELSFFELLMTLPKIGPKSALQILSQADVNLLQNAIISQDPAHLSKMSGITKKTAEKIVLGLKDAFEGTIYLKQDEGFGEDGSGPSFASDAIDALITLGYPQGDARRAIQQIIAGKPEITKVNDAIKEALKVLG
jgi:Holliday junction DNA helicase RuvA